MVKQALFLYEFLHLATQKKKENMAFQLYQMIIHELVKESDNPEAQLFMSDQLMPVEEDTMALGEKLNDIFEQKSDTLQGFFSSPEDALFPGYFQELVESDYEEAAFINFSRESMQALQLSLQGVIGAKGGYLIYMHYAAFEVDMLGVFLIRDTDGMVFKKSTNSAAFEIHPTTYLNTEKLAMAGRINLHQFQAGNNRCLELIKHTKSQKNISEYFINWIGLDNAESSKQLTKTFIKVLDELPLPKREDSEAAMSEEEFKENVMNFAMSRPNKTINLKEFDQQFYQGEETTQSFIQDNEVQLEQEFRFDHNTLKKAYYIKASANGIYLGFNQRDINSGVIILDDDKIIIQSDQLLEKIFRQLDK